MKFVKRLIIMSGEKAKGTLNLERNAHGIFVRLNAYGSQLYACDLIMQVDGQFFAYSLKDGRDSFNLNAAYSGSDNKDGLSWDIDIVHAAIFCGNKLVMYGTNDPKRLNPIEINGFIRHVKRPKQVRANGDNEIFTKAGYMDKSPSVNYNQNRKENFEDFLHNKGTAEIPEYLDNQDVKENFEDFLHKKGADEVPEYIEKQDRKQNSKSFLSGKGAGDVPEYLEKQDEKRNFEDFSPNKGTSEVPEYLDEMLAEENFYPASFNNEFESSMAKKRIAEVFDSYQAVDSHYVNNENKQINDYRKVNDYGRVEDYSLGEVAASLAKADNITAIKEHETVQINQDKKTEHNYRLTPSYMEQIFVLAGLTAKLPQVNLPAANKINKENAEKVNANNPQMTDVNAFKTEKVNPNPTNFETANAKTTKAETANNNISAANTEKVNTAVTIEKNNFNTDTAEKIRTGEDKVAKPAAPAAEPLQKVGEIKSDAHIKARQSTFFEKNSEEIERLFSGEREKNLEQILPSSRWVKIQYDSNGKYYVIGIIGKQYLCYGVPAVYTPTPPDELKGYCWWLPLNAAQPQGKGYWIMYQSLTTGEAILPNSGASV